MDQNLGIQDEVREASNLAAAWLKRERKKITR